MIKKIKGGDCMTNLLDEIKELVKEQEIKNQDILNRIENLGKK